MGGLVCLFGALDLSGAQMLAPGLSEGSRRGLDGSIIGMGFIAAAVAARPVRRVIARVLPIDADNPVHALALSLAVILLGFNLAVLLFTDSLASAQSQAPVTVEDLIASELPFLVLAAAGVGIFLRRPPADAAKRLGLDVPRWWHLTLALAAAGLFIAVAQGATTLSDALTPELSKRIAESTQHAYGPISTSVVGVIAIGLLPGICEEVLFRGALQPRLGLVVTAVLFTSLHIQYGVSFDTVAVLILALTLGVIRKYTNTTTSVVCHCSYNLLVGIGFTGAALNAGFVAEAALIAVSVYAIWNQRVRPAPPAIP